ncbi:MAG: hypothetical protein AVDCRST_MAG13-3683 [uncultured Solirubrobacteraceae bacterium]|uniref:Uncharacterized protein n=1 Tax=uncultured Solirubrobacteraceae bacterium TaxID=1162706 RepID=A0A6J4TK43_9ACTN|nr:MAG: hypothetical protein AVDCRST_MAG13-3683 [uncultured Solirubrobacteraceae bacterium]
MGFLRNVVTDLVEKRLWPVALLLVLALAAVPVLLGRGAEPEPAASAALPAATPAPATARAQIAVDVPVPANRERKGKLRDPFKQRKAKAAPAATAASSAITAKAASGADDADAGSFPAGSGAAPSGPMPSDVTPPASSGPSAPAAPDADAPKADAKDLYRISLRFGRTGKLRTRRDLARLTPLPTVDNPFFVFLGVLEGGKRAVFLVSTDAKATGDGVCKPSRTSCQTIELRVGDTEYFDVERASGPVQYQLDLVSITKEEAGSTSEAVAARARASKDGAEVLEAAGADALGGIDGYRFSRRTGLLERTPVASRASADDAAGQDEADAAETPADPAAAGEPAVAQAATADRAQDKRLRAAVRAVVRGVGRALSAVR